MTADFIAEAKVRYECGEPSRSIAAAMRSHQKTVLCALRTAGVERRPSHKLPDPVGPRFWKLVQRGGPNDCWPFLGFVWPTNGYGNFFVKGVGCRAHRIAFWLTHDRLPKGVCRHKCDNRRCCNPAHLEEGSHRENMQDMVERDRQLKGERHMRAKLTQAEVEVIKALLPTHRTRDLAKQFNISPATISAIRVGRNWGWLP